ncbi:hypothetical protein [Dysgonomonas macrotermitis]|uniref:ATP-grasp domain-containing protein n=1 Tax=Dysgonomonas macrotermitis TaxID=1346286 RepID=A0A1M5AWJ4_9BACT|nr:hypothetical protein [Dysgonomonas macrotermitis]SHF34580.1 hypothetical protein SAMN05444362_105179 [Dysgonomonas macrotermitis]
MSDLRQLYYFNPGHENAILNSSPYYMAPANVVTMQNDLQYLPVWYANPQDVILVDKHLSDDFLHFLAINEVSMAQCITKKDLSTDKRTYQTHLWGISPQGIHKLEEVKRDTGSNLIVPEWNPRLTELSSRKTAQQCLSYLITTISGISSDIKPQFFYDLESLEEEVRQTPYQLLAKAPFSSSGRGLLWLPVEGLTRTERQILHGILKKQGSVSIEKALNKQLDFAMEFISGKSGSVEFTGYSLFETNNKGAYLGNYLGCQQHLADKITNFIHLDLLNKIQNELIEYFTQHFSPHYQGCIGVDMMVYEENGQYLLHPCVEINVRDNMGLIALHLSQNYLDKNTTGSFYIDFSPRTGEIFRKHQQMVEDYPPIISDKKFKKGYFSLCPVTADTKYRAYILLDTI